MDGGSSSTPLPESAAAATGLERALSDNAGIERSLK